MTFVTAGISIIFKKPEEVKPKLFSFLEPFDEKLWGAIIAAVLGTTLVLHFIARYLQLHVPEIAYCLRYI